MKTAALYCRVSTGRQEKEATIESQIDEVKIKADQDGNMITDSLMYVDNGWQGTVLKRPALDAMRDAAARHDFQVLYIWDRDRLSRKYSYQELIIDELQDLGIEVIDLHESISQNPEEKIMFGFKGLFAEYERVKICERMRRGKMYKAKQGIYFSSTANYGYHYIPKTKDEPGYIEIDPVEARNVEIIFKLVGVEKLSIRRAIVRLADMGIKPRKSKRGVWTTSTLSQILRDTIYIGQAYYNRTISLEPENPIKQAEYKQNKKTSRKLKPQEEWIPLSAPAIISQELFEAVQKQLSLNSKYSPRNKKFDYKLAGLLYCHCGCRLSGARSFTQYYYRCISRIKKFPEKDYCKSAGINIQRIEKPVWRAISQLLTQPALIEKQIVRWKKSKPSNNQVADNTQNLKDQIRELDEKEKRYSESYGDQLITLKTYKALMTDIKAQRQRIKSQEQANDKAGHNQVPTLDDGHLKEAISRLVDELHETDQRRLLLKLVDKVQIVKGQKFAKISGYIPLYYNLNTNQNVTQCTINRYRWFTQRRQINPF